MENNSQIKLDTGKFIGKCVFSSKLPALLALAFAIVSVIGGVLKLGECEGQTDLRILYTAGIVINVMMAFFLLHAFFFGAKEGQTGFLELPLIGFEVLAFAYYLLYGYLRLSRLAKLTGFMPRVMGWTYTIYMLLIALSCTVVLSFLKSGFIMKQMSSMLAFIATLGTIASVILAVSYGICLIKGVYLQDEYILFSFADTLLLLVAPILLIGYWKLFAKAGGEIETTFQRIYRRLLRNVAIVDLDDEEQPLTKEEKRFAAKTKSASKKNEREYKKTRKFVDFTSVPFEDDEKAGAKPDSKPEPEPESKPEPKHESKSKSKAKPEPVVEEKQPEPEQPVIEEEQPEIEQQQSEPEQPEIEEQQSEPEQSEPERPLEGFSGLDRFNEQHEPQSEPDEEIQNTGRGRFEEFIEEETPAETKKEPVGQDEYSHDVERFEDENILSSEELAAIAEEKRARRKATAKKIGIGIACFFAVVATVVCFVGFIALNLIPILVKGVMYFISGIMALFAKLRYSISYGLRMVLYDGHVTSKKRKAMLELRKRTIDDAVKIKQSAKKIRLLSFEPVKNAIWGKNARKNAAEEEIEEAHTEEDTEN